MNAPIKKRKLISAANIFAEFQSLTLLKENLIISDDLIFRNNDYKVEKLTFINIQFKGQLFFDNRDLKNGIKFIDCEFDDIIVFNNCNSVKDDYYFLRGDIALLFERCMINKELIVHRGMFEGGICLCNCTIQKANFQQINVVVAGGIELTNNTVVNNSFRINKCVLLKGGINFDHVTINWGLRLESNAVGSYHFSFSKFYKNIIIGSGYCKSISFYQNQFEDEFNLQVVKVEGLISIIECTFSKKFSIELDERVNEKLEEKIDKKIGKIDSLYLSQNNFKSDLSIKKFNDVIISDLMDIEKIDLVYKNLKGSIEFENIKINELNISGYNQNSRLLIENVKLNKVSFKKFRNSGSIDFVNVGPDSNDSLLRIQYSILGYIAFINCQLNKFKKYEIQNSIFDKVISSETKWFNFQQVFTHPLLNCKNLFTRSYKGVLLFFRNYPDDNSIVREIFHIREVFRQLKVAMESQGNRIQGLFFQSQEFIAYEKELQLTHRIFKSERLILWSNRSNSHGQNWVKPIGLAIIFTAFISIFLFKSMNTELEIIWPWQTDFLGTWKIYSMYITSIPELMNPTFRLALVFPDHIDDFTFGTYMWALFQRISISYFIFQTVSAFRKYIK